MPSRSGAAYPISRRGFLAASMLVGGMGAFGLSPAEPTFTEDRKRIRDAWLDMLGPFPETTPPLAVQRDSIDPIDGMPAWHVSFASESDDRVTAYLIVPESEVSGPRPAVICVHSTTGGAGKDRIVGKCGSTHGDPPDPPETSRAYGLELARWGYITLSIDLLCDGERVPDGYKPYDSTFFYERHPEWSMVGKNTWDIMRSVDFLNTVPEVDAARIACLGHSLGGHSSLFAGAFDKRIAAVVSNGGMLSWVRDRDHWSRRPNGKGGSVSSYIYIPRFRPYIDDPELPIPCDFDGLMKLVSPRPLCLMASEGEFDTHDTVAKSEGARDWYIAQAAGDRLSLFTYPGGHNYPPVAKRHSFNWLDRWLGHVPAVHTIWPGTRI